MGRCRSCGAQIDWVVTARGKRIPLDRETSEDGNIVLAEGTARVVQPGEYPGEPRFKTHFATCPDAKRWRK